MQFGDATSPRAAPSLPLLWPQAVNLRMVLCFLACSVAAAGPLHDQPTRGALSGDARVHHGGAPVAISEGGGVVGLLVHLHETQGVAPWCSV